MLWQFIKLRFTRHIKKYQKIFSFLYQILPRLLTQKCDSAILRTDRCYDVQDDVQSISG